MPREPRTIAEAIDACRDRLRTASPTPWLDARILAQHVTGLDASALIAYGETRLEPARRRQLFQLVERRSQGEPVAYLVGKKWFCGLALAVDRRVLVPRPETEELVLLCSDDWAGREPMIIDVGTGSGAIACALAHLLPKSSVLATDVSADALAVARANADALGLSDRIAFLHSDLFDSLGVSARFDVIIANLPYVAERRLDQLEPQVAKHEPSAALLAGDDGLDVYRRLLEQARTRLKDGGSVYLEAAADNARPLATLVERAWPLRNVTIHRDLAGHERMVVCR